MVQDKGLFYPSPSLLLSPAPRIGDFGCFEVVHSQRVRLLSASGGGGGGGGAQSTGFHAWITTSSPWFPVLGKRSVLQGAGLGTLKRCSNPPHLVAPVVILPQPSVSSSSSSLRLSLSLGHFPAAYVTVTKSSRIAAAIV